MNRIIKFEQIVQRIIILILFVSFLLAGLPAQGSGQFLPQNSARTTLSAPPEADISEFDSADNYDPKTANAATLDVAGRTVTYYVLQIEYRNIASRKAKFTDSKKSKIAGAKIVTVTDRFAEIFVKSDLKCNLPQIRDDRSVLRCEYKTEVSAPPVPATPPAKFTSKGIPEKIVRNGFTDQNGKYFMGKNVNFGVIDTGIDFTHPDFIDYDANGNPSSRIGFLWDTTLEYVPRRGTEGPVYYPNGASVGTVFTQEQLTAELRRTKKGESATIPLMDEDGHGSACAGIAAGNGNADKNTGSGRPDVMGVAPQSTIIAVRIGKDGNNLNNSYLLNAIYEWMDKISGNQPLVVSISFGGHGTGHDGQSVAERELDTRLKNGDKQGRVMVISAGNDRRNKIHAKVNFSDSNDPAIVSWTAGADASLKIFFDNPSKDDIRFIQPVRGIVKKPYIELNKITNQAQAILEVAPGEGEIRLFSRTGRQTEAHLYFMDADAGSFKKGMDPGYVVSFPGSASSAVTVGSYDWNDNFSLAGNNITLSAACQNENRVWFPVRVGWLSCYSSPGPTRDNRVKPDIAAPGQWYTASYAANLSDWEVDSTRMYVAMNGTSAATPYTAGIIALLLQKNSNLTANRIKDLFSKNSTKTGLNPAGRIPNNDWGNGKLDFDAVARIFTSLDAANSTK